jgi:hypothetical protein
MSADSKQPTCAPGCVCGDPTLCGTVDPELLAVCPKCGDLAADVDGLGVLIHDACGYCSHPDSYDGVCRNCGRPTGSVECWLDECKNPAYEISLPNRYYIFLCATHHHLLEVSSLRGYSQAEPPPQSIHRGWWPWRY